MHPQSAQFDIIIAYTATDFLAAIAIKEFLEMASVRVCLAACELQGPAGAHLATTLESEAQLAVLVCSTPALQTLKDSSVIAALQRRSKRDWRPFAHVLELADVEMPPLPAAFTDWHRLEWGWSFKAIRDILVVKLQEAGWQAPIAPATKAAEPPASQSVKGSHNTLIQGNLNAQGPINLKS